MSSLQKALDRLRAEIEPLLEAPSRYGGYDTDRRLYEDIERILLALLAEETTST